MIPKVKRALGPPKIAATVPGVQVAALMWREREFVAS